MSGAEQIRARRSRLLVVGDGAQYGNDERIVIAQDLFEAVGRIATCTAREPIEAIVIDGARLHRSARNTVEAIRAVDPAVLVYLVIEGDDDPLAVEASDAGLDGLLYGPLSAPLLSALIDEPSTVVGIVGSAEGMADAEVEDVLEEDEDRLRLHLADAVEDQRARRERSPARDDLIAASLSGRSDALPTATPLRSTPTTSAASIPSMKEVAPAHPASESTVLGDTDLVEAILTDPATVAGLALQLIVQETGWRDVRLQQGDPAPQDRDESTRSASVEHGGEVFGRLISDTAETARLQPWADWMGTWMALAQRQAELSAAAHIDPLTGAWNRRYFEVFLPSQIEAARLERRPLTVVVFDVDDLKKYNDRFGHDAGDDVLREIVRLIRAMIRKGDRVCRIGGDEFVVIFADREARRAGSTPLDSVEQIVRRFQQGICELRFPKLGPDAPGTLSISAGMATYPWDGPDAEALIRNADQLALESKRRGKNLLTIGRASKQACE